MMPPGVPGQPQQMAANPMTQFNPQMMQGQNPDQAMAIQRLMMLLGGLGHQNPLAPGLQAPAPSPRPAMATPGVPQMPQAGMPPGVPMQNVFGGPRA
jgi:hypothetical protein